MSADETMIRLVPMTDEMYHRYLTEYENDPDLLLKGQEYRAFAYSAETAEKYIRRQKDLKRVPLAILCGDDIAGEVIIKNIEAHKCATMGIALKNAKYKDRGIGTAAEELAVRFVFEELDIPVLYADTLRTNLRSRHVLEKAGFSLTGEDEDYMYYRIDRKADK